MPAFVVSTKTNSVSPAIDTSLADLLVAFCVYQNPSAWPNQAFSFSDNKSNTWITIHENAVGPNFTHMLYVASPTIGTGHEFTIGGAYASAAILAYSGFGAEVFPQHQAADAGPASSFVTGMVSLSDWFGLVVSGLGYMEENPTITAEHGFTERESFTFAGGTRYGMRVADKLPTVSGNQEAAWSYSSSIAKSRGIVSSLLGQHPATGSGTRKRRRRQVVARQ